MEMEKKYKTKFLFFNTLINETNCAWKTLYWKIQKKM